ncbi:MAG: hypothetical protein ACR2QC_01560 [Gammaproteobacteria bacterium]
MTFAEGRIVFTSDTHELYMGDGATPGGLLIGPSINQVTSIFGRMGAVTASAGDYTAADINNVPSGNLAGNTVQLALNELQTELNGTVNETYTLTAGVSLTGGGTLAAPRTLNWAPIILTTENNTANADDWIAFHDTSAGEPRKIKVDQFATELAVDIPFSALQDTPNNYTGQINRLLRINGTATGIESFALSASDVPNVPNGNLLSTTLQSAVDELQSDIDALISGVIYQGTWDASTDNPVIPPSAAGNKGHYYVVNVAGTTNKDGINSWNVGDWIISNGTVWEKVDNSSVVSSVFGRTGAITSSFGDYTAAQVRNVPLGNLTSLTVQDALNAHQALLNTAVQETYVLTTSDGLTGGGDLSTPKTIRWTPVSLPTENSVDTVNDWLAFHDDSAGMPKKINVDRFVNQIVGDITFTSLPDTPTDYIGQGGRVLRVNAGATAIESFALSASDVVNVASGNLLATNLQNAVNEIQTEIDSLVAGVTYISSWDASTDTPFIPPASPANQGNYYVVNVAGATNKDGITTWQVGDWIISTGTAWERVNNSAQVTTVFGRAGAVSSSAGDYTASQITNVPAGDLVSATVQDALNELQTELNGKVITTRSLIAGSGLSGGGDFTVDRSIVLDIDGLAAVSVDPATDELAVYDTSATGHAKTTINSLLGTASIVALGDVPAFGAEDSTLSIVGGIPSWKTATPGAWKHASATFSAEVDDRIVVNTTGGAFAITTPPAPVDGNEFIVAEPVALIGIGTAVNPLTITASAGQTIESGAALLIQQNHFYATFVWDNAASNWDWVTSNDAVISGGTF